MGVIPGLFILLKVILTIFFSGFTLSTWVERFLPGILVAYFCNSCCLIKSLNWETLLFCCLSYFCLYMNLLIFDFIFFFNLWFELLFSLIFLYFFNSNSKLCISSKLIGSFLFSLKNNSTISFIFFSWLSNK